MKVFKVLHNQASKSQIQSLFSTCFSSKNKCAYLDYLEIGSSVSGDVTVARKGAQKKISRKNKYLWHQQVLHRHHRQDPLIQVCLFFNNKVYCYQINSILLNSCAISD